MKRIRRILHATDFSKASAPAFRRALDMARRDGAQLLLLHVLMPASPFIGGDVSLPPSYLELQAMARRDAERRLAAVLARARKAGVRARTAMVQGIPSEQIVRLARRSRADLIVIGTHGRSGLRRFFMGSVAERVLQSAPCPVLTVRSR